MKILALRTIHPLLFGSAEVARALGIGLPSAKVVCHRYTRQKVLIRLKRDLYVLSEKWEYLTMVQKYAIANRLQVPSYVSLTTALSFFEVTTQVQQDFFESMAVVRSANLSVENAQFRYFKTQKKLYFGFVKKDDYF